MEILRGGWRPAGTSEKKGWGKTILFSILPQKKNKSNPMMSACSGKVTYSLLSTQIIHRNIVGCVAWLMKKHHRKRILPNLDSRRVSSLLSVFFMCCCLKKYALVCVFCDQKQRYSSFIFSLSSRVIGRDIKLIIEMALYGQIFIYVLLFYELVKVMEGRLLNDGFEVFSFQWLF